MWNDTTLFWYGVAAVAAVWVLADQYWNRKDSHIQIVNETERTLELAEEAADKLERLREIEETLDEIAGHTPSATTEILTRELQEERRQILRGG